MTTVSTTSWGRLALPILLALAGFVAQAAAAGAARWLGLSPDGALPFLLDAGTAIWAWMALTWAAVRTIGILLSGYPRLMADLIGAALFAGASVGILLIVFDFPATGLIATSSVVIAVLGFGLRNIIGDVFAGIVLGIERPYRTGDWVEVTEGSIGRVVEVNWRATRLVTLEGLSLTLPNGLIAVHKVVNYSSEKEGPYRASLRVPMDASVPPERVRRILLSGALEAERSWPGLNADVILREFSDGMAIYAIRFIVPHYGREMLCRAAIAAAVLRALQRVGLGIAAPGQDVEIARRTQDTPRRRKEQLLAHVDLFRPFTQGERQALAEAMETRAILKGTTVVREGEAGESLFLLAEGALDVTTGSADGQIVTLDRLLPGAVLGERSLLTGDPRSATITAATDALLYEVRKEHLDPILRDRPEIVEGLGTVMAERQARNIEKLRAANLPAPQAPDSEDLLGRLKAFFRL